MSYRRNIALPSQEHTQQQLDVLCYEPAYRQAPSLQALRSGLARPAYSRRLRLTSSVLCLLRQNIHVVVCAIGLARIRRFPQV